MNYYEDYWKKNANWSPSDGGLRENEAKFFADYCGKGLVVLDYGCGDANRYGKSLVDGGTDYRGFDISKVAVETAKERGVNVGLLTEEGVTSMQDGEADSALCFEVLEHLMRPDLAVAEIFRCLKQKGTLIVSVPNPGFLPQRIEFLLTGFLCPGGSPQTSRISPWRDAHIRFYNIRSMKRLLYSCGFREVEVVGCRFSLGHFPVVYKIPAMKKLLDLVSLPICWLGKLLPSVFSGTLYFNALK
jgi:SAM-dependent methyltransferase